MKNRSKRKACLASTGTDLHVYNRGVNQSTLFFREKDYLDFCEFMKEALVNSGVTIVLHTLMPNHVHIVIRQDHPYDISSFMKRVCERHAMKINRVKPRSGHLFQGRFNISRISNPGSFLQLSHYIHFNAVAAKLVRKPPDWPYSSVRDYLKTTSSGLVTVEPLLKLVGGPERYRQFLTDYDPRVPDSVWRYLLRAY